jgi:hypothetical protein
MIRLATSQQRRPLLKRRRLRLRAQKEILGPQRKLKFDNDDGDNNVHYFQGDGVQFSRAP